MSEQHQRRRMTRRQLNAAARTIERLARSGTAVGNKRQKQATTEAAPERPEGYRQSVNIGFKARDLANADTVLDEMRRDPGVDSLHSDLGLAKAARYALAKYAEILRARAQATG